MNSVSEELVIGVLNAAYAKGMKPDHAEFPVVQLEKRPRPETVTGIAKGKPVLILGSVVLRVRLMQLSGKPASSIQMRFRILEKGACDWQGLIIGGRAIDCKENGGLGHRTTPHAHVFESLGIYARGLNGSN